MAYQQHSLFSYQGGLSWWYDISSYLALPSGISASSPINKFAFTVKYPYVVRLIIFKLNISSIKYYKNQIVITGKPTRKGLTVVDFDSKNIPISGKIIQLVTPEGYELDYLVNK
ncbi:hypothetical protein [Clostridium oryzae]|uniref:Uncharacterized protein n=1 Tax=Clostridium oryzae TaxID=1450648 RepID=A0A1V4IHH9_9CLOT|nr:hypothetical protein [Clostridium oryzae]OPJ59452.1 hypothetical protein CLORY_32940 [Clostridium oryzae]